MNVNEKLSFTKDMLDLFALYLTQELGLEVSPEFIALKSKEYPLSAEQIKILKDAIGNFNNLLYGKSLQAELKAMKARDAELEQYRVQSNIVTGNGGNTIIR